MYQHINNTVFLALVSSIMALTNPTKDAYLDHAAWHLHDTYCQQKSLPLGVKAACFVGKPLPPDAVKPVIESYTRHQNYFLFSIYTTNFWGKKFHTVGLGGKFLVF